MWKMHAAALPEPDPRVRLRLRRESKPSDQEYWDFCVANPDLRLERTADGEIVIVPPAGPESSYRSSEVTSQLRDWARRDGRGKALDSSVEFFLPDGSALSPDSCWISDAALARFSKAERKKLLHVAPEFIVEVMPPSDYIGRAKAKMEQWIANGVQLG